MDASRRQFIARSGAFAAAAVLAPQDALAAKKKEKRRSRANLIRGGTFPQGVLSGDPAPDAITVLTLLGGVGGAGRVRLEVARDPGFRRVVASRDILTTPAVNHAVKARITGLKPHERYWYRFETRDRHSPVGRLQTALAPGSRATVRFGFFSCADFTHGYYNAYAALAREDLDFVISLGDYIYAETYLQTGDGRAVRDDPIGRPNPYFRSILREAATLDEYRAKYALYRTDPRCARCTRRSRSSPPGTTTRSRTTTPTTRRTAACRCARRFARARRDAAYQAYFESMPVFARGKGARIYRTQPHGRTVELFMLDQRQYREDQPCGDSIRLPCSSWDRQRTILGRRQFGWLKRRLSASDAAWKVVAGQSLIMGNKVHDGEYARYDSWQGYPREREQLLAHLADQRIKDVVFLAGDIHTTVAGDVLTAMGTGPSVAVEFAAGSITSPVPGEANYRLPARQLVPGNDANPRTPPDILAHYRALNPWFEALDLDRHGYGIVTATPSTFDCTLQRVWTIKERGNIGTMPPTGFRWQVKRGQTSIRGTAV